MAEQWQPIGGATREMFLVGKDWTGPENVEAILGDDDSLRAVRATFTKPDGTRVRAIRKHLARSVKHTFQTLEPVQ